MPLKREERQGRPHKNKPSEGSKGFVQWSELSGYVLLTCQRHRITSEFFDLSVDVTRAVSPPSLALAAEELVASASLESYEKSRDQLSRRGIELSQSSFLRDIEMMGELTKDALSH